MGLAPKQRNRLSTGNRCLLLWCLSHFHGGPLELMMVREKRGQAPCVVSSRDSQPDWARSQSPILARVITPR